MNKIFNILKQEKSISLDKFMDIALYDKKFGYYMTKNPFGKTGDYITSPLISNLFGEMLAVWCIAFWEYLGRPKKIVLVELGPGDGTLCKNLLVTFKNFNYFYNCLKIKLLEKSNNLKKIQKSKIRNKKVKWINKINEVNSGPIIFLCNEFFDSLPIKQIYIKKGLFFEKHVALGKNNKKIRFMYKKLKKNLIKDINRLNLLSNKNMAEYPTEAIDYLKEITKKIKKYDGGLLSFDYGYTNNKNQNTLQSIKKHKFSNILSHPGKSDITSHINYKLFSNILKSNGLKVEKIVSQSEFLQKLGIIERAEILSKNMSFKEKANMFYRLKKLLHVKEMGKIFKVLLAINKNKKFSLGF